MGAGKTVKGGIELVETFLKELNKPAKATVKVTEVVASPKAIKGAQDILPTAEREANLAKFLEPSKVKNRVYHGTRTSFKEFKHGEGKDTDFGRFGRGYYFTPDADLASAYTRNETGGNVMPVFLSIKNPYMFRGSESQELLQKLGGGPEPRNMFSEEGKQWAESVREGLEGMGYDGYIDATDPKYAKEIVAFHPNQIKSALGNRGTYDIEDLDITKAAGGEVHMMGGGRPPKKTTLEEDLKSFKDPALALADLLAGALRGTTTAATGFTGDMEELYRQYGKGAVANAVRQFLPTREGKATTFPTIEEMKAMLPPVVPAGAGRSSQVANVGEFLGENNPLAPTALAVAKPVLKAALPLAKKAGQAAKKVATSDDMAYAIENFAQKTGLGPKHIMAYQGSPHLYAATPNNPLGELDPTKIGSGEGAQAYGMGHYLAQNRNVGEEYRNSISSQHGQDVTVGGIPVDEYYMKVYGNADQLPLEEARQQYDKAALIEMLGFNRSPSDILSYAEDMGYAPSVIDWFKTDVIPKTKMPGYLYTHDLSDEAVARMLDWDKPLSQQSQHVKDALEKSDYAFRDMAYDLTGDQDPTGGYIARTGMNPKDFAEHMRSIGIPGVKYLDQNSRARQSMDPEFAEGTRNFVLFPGEEGASNIIRREKAGGAVTMASGGQVKKGIELIDTFLNALKEGDKPAKAAKAAQPSKEVAKAAAKAVKDAEQLASAPVVQTVANPERMQYPGIYKRPDLIAAEAAARVAPESPMLKRLFGVTRNDLYEMGKGRQGNLPGTLPGLASNPKGSKVSAQIMTPQNTQRMIDVMSEAEKYPALVQGMDPWYVMDPLFQRWAKERGLERAIAEYNMQNHLFGMSSPGSEVMTEIPRGSAAYFLHKQDRFPDFEKYAGMPANLRGEDFPQDILTVPGHAYHSTAQAKPMRRFLDKGELDMSSPKVPMYIQASGVPETGFQTATPVGDAHWSRAVGLADVRGGSPANWKKSVSNTEMYDLGPWWREHVAAPLGLESVPAQARAWGSFSPQTGVTTPIGAPKLELIADQTAMAADRLGISPEDALIMWINSQARLGKKEGGAVESDVDGFLDHMNKAQY